MGDMGGKSECTLLCTDNLWYNLGYRGYGEELAVLVLGNVAVGGECRLQHSL